MIKKNTHKNLYKQRLHVKKNIFKVFKFNQIIFIIQYRNKQRLHHRHSFLVKKNIPRYSQIFFFTRNKCLWSTCKKKIKKFLNSIKLFLLFSTEISSTEMSSTEYRDVQYRVPRCLICSVPRCPGPEMS